MAYGSTDDWNDLYEKYKALEAECAGWKASAELRQNVIDDLVLKLLALQNELDKWKP